MDGHEVYCALSCPIQPTMCYCSSYFPQYAPDKQLCLTKAEADYIYTQVEQGREIKSVKMEHESVHNMNSNNEDVWY